MTLIELKRRVDLALLNKRNEDLEVCIPNNIPSMGGISVTHVRGANAGIDWDRSKFIIWPEVKMINLLEPPKPE